MAPSYSAKVAEVGVVRACPRNAACAFVAELQVEPLSIQFSQKRADRALGAVPVAELCAAPYKGSPPRQLMAPCCACAGRKLVPDQRFQRRRSENDPHRGSMPAVRSHVRPKAGENAPLPFCPSGVRRSQRLIEVAKPRIKPIVADVRVPKVPRTDGPVPSPFVREDRVERAAEQRSGPTSWAAPDGTSRQASVSNPGADLPAKLEPIASSARHCL